MGGGEVGGDFLGVGGWCWGRFVAVTNTCDGRHPTIQVYSTLASLVTNGIPLHMFSQELIKLLLTRRRKDIGRNSLDVRRFGADVGNTARPAVLNEYSKRGVRPRHDHKLKDARVFEDHRSVCPPPPSPTYHMLRDRYADCRNHTLCLNVLTPSILNLQQVSTFPGWRIMQLTVSWSEDNHSPDCSGRLRLGKPQTRSQVVRGA